MKLEVKIEGVCEHCGHDIVATMVTRSGHKYCSQACAKAATGQDFDPDKNRYLIDARNGRLITY